MGMDNNAVRPTLVCDSEYWCPYQDYEDVLFEEQLKTEYLRLYGNKVDRTGHPLVDDAAFGIGPLPRYSVMILSIGLTVVAVWNHRGSAVADSKQIYSETT